MGRNGSGKSSLLWALQGSGRRHAGAVRVAGRTASTRPPLPRRRRRAAGRAGAADRRPTCSTSTPSRPSARQADREAACPAGTCAALLDRLAPGIDDDRHPRDLSEGQRLALVLAVQLDRRPAGPAPRRADPGPRLRGQGGARASCATSPPRGRAVVVATHDVEFVAEAADRVVVMAEGEVVADGPTADVIVASPAFAPQVAKVLAPLPCSPSTTSPALDGVPAR